MSVQDLAFELGPTQGDFVMSKKRYVWLIGGEGEGKCLKIDTPVILYDGRVEKIQNIVPGDLLMGPDSKPRKVLALGRGQAMMYEVVPYHGDPFTANGPHILPLVRSGTKKRYRNGKIIEGAKCPQDGDRVNITVDEWLKKPKNFKNDYVMFRASVDFPERKLKVDPYWLGLWLADGTNVIPQITNPDEEIIDYLKGMADRHGMVVSVATQKATKCCSYRLVSSGRAGANPFLNALKYYGLIKNKHVPTDFKMNNRKNRLAFLAGVLDGDGHLRTAYAKTKSGRRNQQFEFLSKLKGFAEDVAFISRSLGFRATLREKYCEAKNWGVEGVYWRVVIAGDLDQIPTKVRRKQALPRSAPSNRSKPKDVLRTGIKSIKPVGVDDYYGVVLDGDHLFLLGDFTVTHNTYAAVVSLFTHRDRLDPFLPRKKDSKGNTVVAPMYGAFIRDTHATIKRHTVRSIESDFPGVFTFKDDYHRMIGPGMEIDLFGMQDMGSLNKIQGGAYHIISLEEPAPIVHTGNAGIRHDAFLMCARRIRGKQVEVEGKMQDAPRRLQVTMNPAEKEHWTYKEAVVNPLTDTDVFRIPKGENIHLSAHDRKAREEAFRDRPDLAARYDEGKFADVYPGVKITPEYQEDLHLAKKRVLPIPGAQHYRFWDGGLNPTMVVLCISPAGQLLVLDCVSMSNVGMRQLIQQKVLPLLALPRYQVVAKTRRLWRDIGDASLRNREQSNSDNDAASIIEELLGADFEKGVQEWDPRREAIKDVLTRAPGGRPFLQVNPVVTEGEPFNRVHAALAGGYAYKVTATGQVLMDGPDKAPVHSHVGDAMTHGLARLFFRAPRSTIKYDKTRDLRRAAGYGVG